MKVLLTGGAGFIGSHIADQLLAGGHEVRIVDAFLPAAHGPDPTREVPAGRELIVGDLRDPQVCSAAVSGVDAICHQAAMVGLGVDLADMPEYVGNNDLATATLLSAAAGAGIGNVVLASSMVIYGEGRYECAVHGVVRPLPRAADDLTAGDFDPHCPHCGAGLTDGLVDEDVVADPRNTYAVTKLAQEHLAAVWVRETGGSVTALRYHNVYGARMPKDTPYAGVASIFRSTLESGGTPQVFEDGGQRRDFVEVRDVAAANIAALSRIGGFRAYNVASGEPHTIADMAAALADAMGGASPEVTGGFRLGDVRHIVASPARAERELGFRAGVSFAEGMREFATAPLRG